MIRIVLMPAVAMLLSGCGHYADFSLPHPQAAEMSVAVRWESSPQPVMDRGGATTWDGVDVLNPSVVKFGGRYLNLYSGYDGKTWHTGLAESVDGLKWTGRRRILSPDPATWEGNYIAANGTAIEANGELLYWYQAGDPPRIGLARSRDGVKWTKHAEPVVPLGPRGSWDERAAADPYVIRKGNVFYLFYLGQDRARRQRLGVARSEDGVVWEKLRANPVLELGGLGAFDEYGLGEPAVWEFGGRYWMLYTGRDKAEYRRLGLAWSRDGVKWERWPGPAMSGDQPWNEKVICDPSVELTPHGVLVWFGGGNVARPDQNINGKIGLATLYMDALQ
jgi:predicted GH43/DUF377 family glycosyl hydrolase